MSPTEIRIGAGLWIGGKGEILECLSPYDLGTEL